MAAKKTEESRQGLIIALVFFVLISIGLGVATFYGFNDQQRLNDLVRNEKKNTDKMRDSRDWEQFQNLALKRYLGHTLAKEDEETLTALLPKYEGGQLGRDEKTRPDFDNLNKKLQTDTDWDKLKNLPARNLFDQIKTLQTAEANLTAQKAQIEKKSQEDIKKLSTDLKEKQTEVEDLSKQRDQNNADKAKLTATKAKEFQDALASIEKLQNEVDDIKKKTDTAKDDSKKKIDGLNKSIKELTITLDKARDQIKPPNVLDYDQPKGKVLAIERAGAVVYVDLGTADRVKPQLTFSIYGVGPNGKAMAERKGSLEIANVLGPHRSRARVTELTDGNRDPVLTGDLLFNPIWSPSLQQHIAVAGLIDLTGEGTDNTMEFIGTLERQGIVVDAYIDLNNLTIKRKGMTQNTAFLVLGDQPEFDNTQAISTSDVRTASRVELQKRMSDMQTEAAKLGVPPIPFRRFLGVIGYPMPRVLTTRTGTSGFLNSPALGAGMREKDSDKAKSKGKPDKEAIDKDDKEPPKGKDKDLPKDKEKEAPRDKDKETPKDKEAPKDKPAAKDKEK
jgi:hypothetical protein